MKKTLALLLASSALLTACGTTDEPEAAEEDSGKSPIDAATEYLEKTDETDDVADVGEEIDYGDVDDEDYFSIHYHQGGEEVEHRIEDASELSGLYSVELPEEGYFTREDVPQKTFIDIKEDGRATVVTYQLIDPTVKDEFTGEQIGYFAYLDEQNNFIQVKQPTPDKVVLASGYLVQEFGETQFKFVEYSSLKPHLNEKGEMALSSPSNSTAGFIRKEIFKGDEHDATIKEPIELSLDEVTLTKANSDDVGLAFLLNNGGLSSVGQVYMHLMEEENERIQKKIELETYEDDQTPIHFENNNELMHYLLEIDRYMYETNIVLADDPSEYYGYTEDNTEVTPDVVFLNDNGEGRALNDDGTLLEYHPWDGNWHDSSTD